MLGGLFYEMLTVGKVPFHWLLPLYPATSLHQRRTSAEAVPGSDGHLRPGLLDKNVLEAAVIDGVEPLWSVHEAASPGSSSRLREAQSLVERCCLREPTARLDTQALSDTLRSLLNREREVVSEAVVEPAFSSLQVRPDKCSTCVACSILCIPGATHVPACMCHPAQAVELLRPMGFSVEVADDVGESILDHHQDLASLKELVRLVRVIPGVDPEVPLLVRQLLSHPRVSELLRSNGVTLAMPCT
jgi:hypothetical protein